MWEPKNQMLGTMEPPLMQLSVKVGKAGGPDGISARLIKEFSYELSKPLTDILNQSYREGTNCAISVEKGCGVPIPKTKPAKWEKLRPVSLTDHFSKLGEGFMAKWLLEDLESNIDSNQYGNMNGVSTSHYLVRLMDTLLKNSDKAGHIILALLLSLVSAKHLI